MCTFGAAPHSGRRRPARTSPASSKPTTAATNGRGSTAPDAYSSTVPANPPDALSTPNHGQVLQHDPPAVHQARRARKSNVDNPAARLDQVQGERGQERRVGRVDHRVETQPGQGVGGPGVFEAERAGELQRRLVAAQQVNLGALRGGDLRDQ